VKKFKDMRNHFDRLLACDRQTDRLNRRTNGRTSCDGIVHAMYSIAR